MEIILTVISLVLLATSIFFFRSGKNSHNLQSKNLISDERVKNLLSQLQEQTVKFESLLEENRHLNSFKGKYEHAQSEISFLREEKNKLAEDGNILRHKILEFEKQNELLKQSAQELQSQKEEWNKNKDIDVKITNGRTSLNGRENNPEAIDEIADKQIPGFGEVFRTISLKTVGTSAIQSRACAVLANGKYVFALPGSSGGVTDAWDGILKYQLDINHKPCNFVELFPRLKEK